jgi:5-(carboxyamino)imidazole ribonucleotide mutase
MNRSSEPPPLVAILIGSDSDWDTLQHAVETLRSFGVAAETHVMSAHRTPERVAAFAAAARERGLQVLIAAAGGAAHLAGVVASHTTLPVIGVPVKGWALDGLDSLLSTAQMPGGIPVATMAIGKAGAINAALLATQILALSRPELQAKLDGHKQQLRAKVDEGEARINAKRQPVP